MGVTYVTAPVEILTPRFRLKELRESDVTSRYLGWLADPAAQHFIAAAQQTHELSVLTEYVKQRVNCPDVFFLGIFDQLTGLHVGNVKYEPVDSVKGYAIMGILIGEMEFRGKGVATEVLMASGQWLKHNRAISQIFLGVSVDNQNAIKAYRKAGFIEMDTPHIKNGTPNTITMGWML